MANTFSVYKHEGNTIHVQPIVSVDGLSYTKNPHMLLNYDMWRETLLEKCDQEPKYFGFDWPVKTISRTISDCALISAYESPETIITSTINEMARELGGGTLQTWIHTDPASRCIEIVMKKE